MPLPVNPRPVPLPAKPGTSLPSGFAGGLGGPLSSGHERELLAKGIGKGFDRDVRLPPSCPGVRS